MKGFRRLDEMEKYVAYQSVFWSYAYMVAFLAAWAAYDLWSGTSPVFPIFLFVTQWVVQTVIRSVLRRRLSGSGGANEE